MRGTGLIVAGSLFAACGGPGTDASSNSEAESHEVAAQNQPVINGQVDAQQAPEVANMGDNVQAESVSPCLIQGADRLQVAPIRAVGTEPFWGARVEGRCVTYTTPENQQGVRIWTRYSTEEMGMARGSVGSTAEIRDARSTASGLLRRHVRQTLSHRG